MVYSFYCAFRLAKLESRKKFLLYSNYKRDGQYNCNPWRWHFGIANATMVDSSYMVCIELLL